MPDNQNPKYHAETVPHEEFEEFRPPVAHPPNQQDAAQAPISPSPSQPPDADEAAIQEHFAALQADKTYSDARYGTAEALASMFPQTRFEPRFLDLSTRQAGFAPAGPAREHKPIIQGVPDTEHWHYTPAKFRGCF